MNTSNLRLLILLPIFLIGIPLNFILNLVRLLWKRMTPELVAWLGEEEEVSQVLKAFRDNFEISDFEAALKVLETTAQSHSEVVKEWHDSLNPWRCYWAGRIVKSGNHLRKSRFFKEASKRAGKIFFVLKYSDPGVLTEINTITETKAATKRTIAALVEYKKELNGLVDLEPLNRELHDRLGKLAAPKPSGQTH